MKANIWAVLVTAGVFLSFGGNASAEGLRGQVALDSTTSKAITAYTRELLRTGGDPSRARPALLLVVERNAAADLTDNLSGALRDRDSYTALAATLEDALAAAGEKERPFIRFNLARVHMIRAGYLTATASRNAALDRASRVAEDLRGEVRDPAADGLQGDIESLRGRVDEAAAAFKRMVASGGSRAESLFRTGVAYARGRRYTYAEQSLAAAARTPGPDGILDPQLTYRANQELAATYLLGGNYPEAAKTLKQSVVKLGSETPLGFPFRLDVAQRLLTNRAYIRDVQTYLETVVRLAPDNEDARTLLARVKAMRR
ncbi:MAG: tetratricopeptide repeat protein [Armatimonadota bacterium]